jgi:hypothetical protein
MAATNSTSPSSISPPSIFSEEQWQTLYPEGESEHSTMHPLHYLAAHKKSPSEVEGFLQGKDRAFITKILKQTDEQHHNFLPLTVAIMRTNLNLAVYLLTQAEKYFTPASYLNYPDEYGFTALHHAALTAPNFVKMLLFKGADPTIRTKGGYTYQHLQMLTDPNLPAHSAKTTFWELNGELRRVSELTQSEFKQLGVTHYRDIPLYIGQLGLHTLWQHKLSEANYDPKIMGCKGTTLTHFPLLEVRQSPSLPSGQMGLFAKEFLPQGTFVGTYAGTVTTPIQSSTLEGKMKTYWRGKRADYAAGDIDGQEVCSPITRANVGSPNVLYSTLRIDTLFVDMAFVVAAPDGIQPGEEILWNYGPSSPLVWSEQKLFNKRQIDDFVNGGLEKIFEIDEKQSSLTQNYIALMRSFILSNPKALIYAHLTNAIKADHWLKYWRSSVVVDEAIAHNPFDTFNSSLNNQHEKNRIYALLCVLRDWEVQMAKVSAAQHNRIREWLLNAIDHHTVFQLTRVIELIIRDPNPEEITVEKVVEGIADYDWLNDPDSILRYKNVLRNLITFFEKEGLMTREQIAVFLMQGTLASVQRGETDTHDFSDSMSVILELVKEFGELA